MNPDLSKPPRFARDPFLLRRTLLHPPQYGLSALLALVSLCCLFFAAYKFIGAAGAAAILLLALAVMGHVLGNAIGSRLRELGDEGRQRELPAGARPRGKRLAAPGRSAAALAASEATAPDRALSRFMTMALALRSVLLVIAGLALGYWSSSTWFVAWDWTTVTGALSACGLVASAIGVWVSAITK